MPSYLQNNAKPKHYLFSQEMQKLNRLMEGRTRCGEVSEVSLFGFRCVFILLAMAERDGRSLQGSHLKQKLKTLEPVT